MIIVYTDGSCDRHNKGHSPGGWAFVSSCGVESYGALPNATSNQMELEGVIKALDHFSTISNHIVIYSDSKYTINSASTWVHSWAKNGWVTKEGTPVKNRAQMKAILYLKKKYTKVEFYWIKGHSGNRLNERADTLASMAKEQFIKRKNKGKSTHHLHCHTSETSDKHGR